MQGVSSRELAVCIFIYTQESKTVLLQSSVPVVYILQQGYTSHKPVSYLPKQQYLWGTKYSTTQANLVGQNPSILQHASWSLLSHLADFGQIIQLILNASSQTFDVCHMNCCTMPGYFPKAFYVSTSQRYSVFSVALFTKSELGSYLGVPVHREMCKRIWYTYPLNFLSAIKEQLYCLHDNGYNSR